MSMIEFFVHCSNFMINLTKSRYTIVPKIDSHCRATVFSNKSIKLSPGLLVSFKDKLGKLDKLQQQTTKQQHTEHFTFKYIQHVQNLITFNKNMNLKLIIIII